MKQHLLNKDVLTGLLFGAIGIFALWGSRNLPVGNTAQMHAGFIPHLLAYLLMALGGFIAIVGLMRGGTPIAVGRPRPLIAIILAIVAFAVLLKFSGLFLAVTGLVLIASLASAELRRTERLVVTVSLLFISIAVFRYGLRMPIAVIDGFWQ
jgi:hypothetical protein